MALGRIQVVKCLGMAKRFTTNKLHTALHVSFLVASPCITKPPPELEPAGKVYQRIGWCLFAATYKLFDGHSHVIVNHLLVNTSKVGKELIMGFHKSQGILSVE